MPPPLPSNKTEINAVEFTLVHLALRLVATIKPRVLIVWDYDDEREILRKLMEVRNCRMTGGINGLAAVEMTVLIQRDVILTDVRLALIDGLEITRRIRKHELFGEGDCYANVTTNFTK